MWDLKGVLDSLRGDPEVSLRVFSLHFFKQFLCCVHVIRSMRLFVIKNKTKQNIKNNAGILCLKNTVCD